MNKNKAIVMMAVVQRCRYRVQERMLLKNMF